jgi:hypothetical protein
MWAHYADQGSGFVVGLDSKNSLFLSKCNPRKNLLRKVLYSDQRIQNFWNNPYYLFLVKNSGWSYEREWRIIKELSECDECHVVGGDQIFLSRVPCEAIKEIYFGYCYEMSQVKKDMYDLACLGCDPAFFKIDVDARTGQFVPKPV